MKTALFVTFCVLIISYINWPKSDYDKADAAYKEIKYNVQILKERVAKQNLKF